MERDGSRPLETADDKGEGEGATDSRGKRERERGGEFRENVR